MHNHYMKEFTFVILSQNCDFVIQLLFIHPDTMTVGTAIALSVEIDYADLSSEFIMSFLSTIRTSSRPLKWSNR